MSGVDSLVQVLPAVSAWSDGVAPRPGRQPGSKLARTAVVVVLPFFRFALVMLLRLV